MVRSDRYLRPNASKLGIDPSLINPASVDLRLGTNFKIWWGWKETWDFPNPFREGPIPMDSGYALDERISTVSGKSYWYKEVNLSEGDEILFAPDMFYLAHSLEAVKIPRNKIARLYLKSTSARGGLEHKHACWIDPAFQGQITFELTSDLPFKAIVGEPICQITIEDCEEPLDDYDVTGRYQNQIGATEAIIIERITRYG